MDSPADKGERKEPEKHPGPAELDATITQMWKTVAGDASSSLVLPAGFATPYIGRTVYLAAVSFQPPATGRLSSVAVTLGIDP